MFNKLTSGILAFMFTMALFAGQGATVLANSEDRVLPQGGYRNLAGAESEAGRVFDGTDDPELLEYLAQLAAEAEAGTLPWGITVTTQLHEDMIPAEMFSWAKRIGDVRLSFITTNGFIWSVDGTGIYDDYGLKDKDVRVEFIDVSGNERILDTRPLAVHVQKQGYWNDPALMLAVPTDHLEGTAKRLYVLTELGTLRDWYEESWAWEGYYSLGRISSGGTYVLAENADTTWVAPADAVHLTGVGFPEGNVFRDYVPGEDDDTYPRIEVQSDSDTLVGGELTFAHLDDPEMVITMRTILSAGVSQPNVKWGNPDLNSATAPKPLKNGTYSLVRAELMDEEVGAEEPWRIRTYSLAPAEGETLLPTELAAVTLELDFTPDDEAPVLEGITRLAGTVAPWGRDIYELAVYDDVSGVYTGVGTMRHTLYTNVEIPLSFNIGVHFLAGTVPLAAYLPVQEQSLNGEYVLSSLTLIDYAGNVRVYTEEELQAIPGYAGVTITGATDHGY